MPIEFESLRGRLEADRSAIISETVELCSGLIEDNEKGKIEDFDSRIEHGRSILQDCLNIGSLIEFLDVEERSICEAQEEHDRYLEEKEAAIVAKLEHAGVDLTGIVEPKDKAKESGTVLPEPAEEIEERKKREMERIRKNLGNVEAFQLENDPSEGLLEEKIRLLRLGINYYERVPAFFGKSLRNVKLRDFVSHSEAEIRKGLLNGNEEKFNRALSRLHEIGLIPDEKWDYAEMVDEFMQNEDLDFSPEARIVMMNALAESSEWGTIYLGEEHIWLGLVRDADSPIRKRMEALGVSLEGMRGQVYHIANVTVSERPSEIEAMNLSQGAKKILKEAKTVAERAHGKIEPEMLAKVILGKTIGTVNESLFRLELKESRKSTDLKSQ